MSSSCEKIDLMPYAPKPQFLMPAEWAPHAATWLVWPQNSADWPNKFQPIPWVYAEIVRHLSASEEVHLLVNSADVERRALAMLKRGGANLARLHFHQWPTDRVWIRDSGPLFTKDAAGEVSISNWCFNAWAKYDNWRRDNLIPQHVADLYDMPQRKPTVTLADGTEKRVVLEGGSIDVNGAGTLLTTEECLLSDVQQRNPGVSREQLEAVFREHLGIEQVLWLHRGTAGDDTHGHVDDITRFVGENKIVTAVEPNTADENHLPLAENLARLHAARNLQGIPSRSFHCPCPRPSSLRGSVCPPATPTSTSPTPWCSSPRSTTQTIVSP